MGSPSRAWARPKAVRAFTLTHWSTRAWAITSLDRDQSTRRRHEVYPFMLSLVCVLLLSMRLADAHSPRSHSPQAYMRVVQDDGVWWFQDGAGRKFFSLGVNCVGGCYGHAEATPMLPVRQQRIVSLLRRTEGFNTARSRSSFCMAGFVCGRAESISPFLPHAHDVFDAAFWQGPYADHLREEVKPFRGMKHILGYFLDNEPAWNAQRIFAFYLRLGKAHQGAGACLPT